MYSMAYQVLIMVLPLITAPYLSRVVGAEGTGIYSYTYSIAQYFVYFAMLGISNYGNRSIAKVRENIGQRNYTFSSIYQLQILTSLVAIVIYLLYCFVFVHENRNISLLQGFFVLSAIFDISWLFWGMENFKVTVTRQMLVKICSAICIFLFVKSPLDLWKYTTILSQIDTQQEIKLDGRKINESVQKNPNSIIFFNDARTLPYDVLVKKWVPDSKKEMLVTIIKRHAKNLPFFKKMIKKVRS